MLRPSNWITETPSVNTTNEILKNKFLVNHLLRCGFKLEEELGFAIPTGERPRKLSHPNYSRSSFYVATNYISALGKFRDFVNFAKPTLFGRFNEPIWQGADLHVLIEFINANYPAETNN